MNDQSNKQNSENKDSQLGKHIMEDSQKESGGMENASANRGGTTDMSEDALTVGRRNVTERGSGMHPKGNVTGSDYDGQVS